MNFLLFIFFFVLRCSEIQFPENAHCLIMQNKRHTPNKINKRKAIRSMIAATIPTIVIATNFLAVYFSFPLPYTQGKSSLPLHCGAYIKKKEGINSV